MRIIQIGFGIISFAMGVVLGLTSIVGFATSEIPMGVLTGFFALAFLAVGSRWIRGRKNVSWRDDPATERQKSFANELGIAYAKNISKGDLSDLISEATGN